MKDFGIICAPDLVAHNQRDEQGLITCGMAMGDILAQNESLLVVAAPGEFKATPTVGAGAMRFLRDDDTDAFIAAVCSQLRGDGMAVVAVEYKNDELKIDASYES